VRLYSLTCCRVVFVVLAALTLAMNSFAGAKETILYSFPYGGWPPPPVNPSNQLVADSAGNLYGTASGFVVELSPPAEPGGPWTLATLCECSAGGNPIFDKSGNLYYSVDGRYVAELSPPTTAGGAWNENILWYFRNAVQGQALNSTLVLDADGSLWGATVQGGTGTLCGEGSLYGCGLVFHLVKNTGGNWHENIVYNFGTFSGDAAHPWTTLVVHESVIYGTTSSGGSGDGGTVFRLARSGGAWDESILYNFNASDGLVPEGLLEDPAGNLYGVASSLEVSGEIFELSPPSGAGGSWTKTSLHTFTGKGDGSYPNWPLWRDSRGDLYGTTSGGNGCGAFRCGTAVKLKAPATLSGSWTLQVLHDFKVSGDGYLPLAGLTFFNGTFYGTTVYGGNAFESDGTVYSIVP
jgi:uncharacterized repeat protein (TIGR03803 family)